MCRAHARPRPCPPSAGCGNPWTTQARPERTWVRIGLAFLALTELPTGIWAVVDPKGWYDNFPGFGRHWIAVSGPYNQHLATDAGAGFLAVGVLLVIAIVLVDHRVLVQAALVTFLVQDVPHFVFHLVHHEGLSASDKVTGVGGLGFDAVVAAVLLLMVSRPRTPIARRDHVSTAGP